MKRTGRGQRNRIDLMQTFNQAIWCPGHKNWKMPKLIAPGSLGFSLSHPQCKQQQPHTHKHTRTQWQNKRSPSSAVARQAEPSAAVSATLSWSAARLTTSFTRHLLAVNHTRGSGTRIYVCVCVSWGYWWNCRGQDETCQSRLFISLSVCCSFIASTPLSISHSESVLDRSVLPLALATPAHSNIPAHRSLTTSDWTCYTDGRKSRGYQIPNHMSQVRKLDNYSL